MADPTPSHSHRVTLVLAAIALVVSAYATWRVDTVRDLEAATRERVQQLETAKNELRAALESQVQREARAREELQSQWRSLSELPQQLRDLEAAHEDLRTRTERPQRAWSRAEAAYLLELAQRRLLFDRDIPTAIAAVEAADSRLAGLRDPAFDSARARIGRDLQALRAVSAPDRVAVISRLAALEAQADSLPLKGVLVGQRQTSGAVTAPSFLGRVRQRIAVVFDRLFAVHRLDGESAQIVSLEAQALRRQHLASLIYDARHAVLLSDSPAYRSALTAIDAWLARYFAEGEAMDEVGAELAWLEKVDIAPVLPDLSGTVRLLGSAPPQRTK